MTRSTVESWLEGPGDLATREVEDVPVKGQNVLVRALPGRYSAQVSSQWKMEMQGREQIARIDQERMEILQFTHGVVEPKFSEEQARMISEKYGSAFRKVITVIDEISGVDKEAITEARATFPSGGEGESGKNGAAGTPTGGAGAAVPARAGAGAGDVDSADR